MQPGWDKWRCEKKWFSFGNSTTEYNWQGHNWLLFIGLFDFDFLQPWPSFWAPMARHFGSRCSATLDSSTQPSPVLFFVVKRSRSVIWFCFFQVVQFQDGVLHFPVEKIWISTWQFSAKTMNDRLDGLIGALASAERWLVTDHQRHSSSQVVRHKLSKWSTWGPWEPGFRTKPDENCFFFFFFFFFFFCVFLCKWCLFKINSADSFCSWDFNVFTCFHHATHCRILQSLTWGPLGFPGACPNGFSIGFRSQIMCLRRSTRKTCGCWESLGFFSKSWSCFGQFLGSEISRIHQELQIDGLESVDWFFNFGPLRKVLLAVFGTLVGTIGKQMIRRSEMYKQDLPCSAMFQLDLPPNISLST